MNANVCWAWSIVEGLRWLEAHVLIDFLASAPDEHLQAAQSWAQSTQTLGCWLSWLLSSLAEMLSRCMCVSGSVWHGNLWIEMVGPSLRLGYLYGQRLSEYWLDVWMPDSQEWLVLFIPDEPNALMSLIQNQLEREDRRHYKTKWRERVDTLDKCSNVASDKGLFMHCDCLLLKSHPFSWTLLSHNFQG